MTDGGLSALATRCHRPNRSDPGRIGTAATSTGETEAEIAFRARLLDAVGQPVVATDPDGHILYCNPPAEDLFGWSANEVLGRSAWDLLWSGEPAGDAGSPTRRAQAKGWSGELTARYRGGSTFPVHAALSPVLDGERRVVGSIGVFRDIRREKQIEAELRASEERYRALLGATASILWRARTDGSIFQVVGFDDYPGPKEDLLGFGWLDLVHRDDRDRHAREWLDIIASDEPGESLYRFVTAARDHRWVTCRAVLLRNPDGTVREWAGYLVDVHERVLADEALQRSQDELRAAVGTNRTILEHSLDVICTMDRDRVFTQVSPRALDRWGYVPEELVGRRFMELVHPDDLAKTRAVFEQILAGTPTFAFENRLIRKDGSVLPVLWSYVWAEEHGTIFAVARDLTERLKTEERLRQSQKIEAIGQLTGGIAHDFNNLLTVILGNAEELTEDESLPPEARRQSMAILETAERGAELIRHLLAFGRRQTLKPVLLRLDEVVQGIVPLLGRSIGEHVEFGTKFEPSELLTLADRTLLESAILNLAVNARDAMGEAGMLTITTGERAAGPGEGLLTAGRNVAFVTVSDTGCGMPPEVLERAFEPFFTTKEVGKGSGLGLPMVHGFTQQSGGHVAIESKVGQGTSVTILLPALTPAEAGQRADSRSGFPRSGKERILVVEDEADVLGFVSTQLRSLGYAVVSVSSGPDAIAILRGDAAFDLLLTDIVLPKGMSGVELSRAAREFKPDLKVLLTSGYPEEVVQGRGPQEGQALLLRKPYRRRELAIALRTALDTPP